MFYFIKSEFDEEIANIVLPDKKKFDLIVNTLTKNGISNFEVEYPERIMLSPKLVRWEPSIGFEDEPATEPKTTKNRFEKPFRQQSSQEGGNNAKTSWR